MFSQLSHLICSCLPTYFRSNHALRGQGQGQDQSEGLLRVEQVADVFQEPYIFTGYRQTGKPWSYYLHSFFFLHNESVNVWTHILGFLVVFVRLLIYFRDVDVLGERAAWPVIAFGAGALSNLALSATAHLFHSKSRWHHFVFFLLDYMGVTLYMFGTGVASMYICSTHSFHHLMLPYFLPLNVVFSWGSFLACCMAKLRLCHDDAKRKTIMVTGLIVQSVFISLPTLSRYSACVADGSCSLGSLNHLTVVFLLICTCAALYTHHWPESWAPGRLDIWGHGHQIFHVVAVVNMLSQVRALDIEVNILKNAETFHPVWWHMVLSYVVLCVLEVLTLLYYVRFLVFRRMSEEIPRLDVRLSLTGQTNRLDNVQPDVTSEEDKKVS